MGTLNYHESNVATEARKRLHSLTAPATPGARAPRALVAVLLDALYHRALQQPKNVDDHGRASAIGEAGMLYETLTDREPGWIERSPGYRREQERARAARRRGRSYQDDDPMSLDDEIAERGRVRLDGQEALTAVLPFPLFEVGGVRMAIGVVVAGDGEVEILLNPDVSERRAEVVTLREGDPIACSRSADAARAVVVETPIAERSPPSGLLSTARGTADDHLTEPENPS